jgi:threonylcarbamoyladenosine tRNA methylthiotransferase MtaB
MPGSVRTSDKEHRSRQLIKLSGRKRIQFMQSATGNEYDVLLEKRNSDGMLSGLTGNYIRTLVPYRKDLPGKVRRVRLVSLRDDASMTGELIETGI